MKKTVSLFVLAIGMAYHSGQAFAQEQKTTSTAPKLKLEVSEHDAKNVEHTLKTLENTFRSRTELKEKITKMSAGPEKELAEKDFKSLNAQINNLISEKFIEKCKATGKTHEALEIIHRHDSKLAEKFSK